MSNEIRQIWLKGKTLTTDVFKSDGSEREFGISLTEHAGTHTSLYTGNCATIQPGDSIATTDSNNHLIGGGAYTGKTMTHDSIKIVRND